MRIGTRCVGGQRRPVGQDRLLRHPQVLEGDAEIEQRDHIVRVQLDGLAIVKRGSAGISGLVEEPSEIHPRIRMRRIQLQRPAVRARRLVRRRLFQVAGALVPVGGIAAAGADLQRRHLPGQLLRLEVEEHLSRLRAP